MILLFAGRFIYAVVEHRGRKSGRAYRAPVVAHLHGGCIYIPLPYGDDTDWFRNLAAAGGGAVRLSGKTYRVRQPMILEQAEALPVFPAFSRSAFRRAKIEKYLCLQATKV